MYLTKQVQKGQELCSVDLVALSYPEAKTSKVFPKMTEITCRKSLQCRPGLLEQWGCQVLFSCWGGTGTFQVCVCVGGECHNVLTSCGSDVITSAMLHGNDLIFRQNSMVKSVLLCNITNTMVSLPHDVITWHLRWSSPHWPARHQWARAHKIRGYPPRPGSGTL